MTALLAAAFFAASSAGAQSAPAPRGPAFAALQRLADGAAGEAAFDGDSLPRREGPLLILEEHKDVVLRRRALRRLSYDVYGSDSGRLLYSGSEGPESLVVYGTRQKVAIVDRRGYVRRAMRRAAGRGALVGAALGALVALLNPIDALVIVTAAVFVVASAAFAADAARNGARQAPSTFERIVRKHREIEP